MLLALAWSYRLISPIAYWPFDGIKMFPNIFLFSSKIKLVNPNTYFRRKIPKLFLFFSLESLPQTDTANLPILFSVNDFNTRIHEHFDIIFQYNVSSNNVCIGLRKIQNAENHNPKDCH